MKRIKADTLLTNKKGLMKVFKGIHKTIA